jgi:ribosome-binding protein aMBF1 (putative translation factor)
MGGAGMSDKKRRTRNFGDVIRAELAADPELEREVREEKFHAQIARQVYELRQGAGLTQAELAERIGTKQSVISRIEDSDYEGHSLAILLRIAFALKKELRMTFADPPIPSQRVRLGRRSKKLPIQTPSL